MKVGVLVTFALALLLSGCGKINQARNTVKALSSAAEAAKGMSRGAGADAGKAQVAVDEPSVRRFYTAVVKLRQKYQGIEFENAIAAAVQAGSQGKDLKKIVPAETGLAFDDYSGLSGAIMMTLASGAMVAIPSSAVPQMEATIKSMEATDTSQMSAEQKTQVRQQIEAQKKALEQMKAQASSPDAVARKAQFDMISRVRKEMGL